MLCAVPPPSQLGVSSQLYASPSTVGRVVGVLSCTPGSGGDTITFSVRENGATFGVAAIPGGSEVALVFGVGGVDDARLNVTVCARDQHGGEVCAVFEIWSGVFFYRPS